MINKIFQANHKNQWPNTEATGTEGLVIGPLELAIRVVASGTRLPTFTVRLVSLVTGPSTLVNKMTSSIIEPPTLVMAWHLWTPNC